MIHPLRALRRLNLRNIGFIEMRESRPIVNPFHRAFSGNPIIIKQWWTRRVWGGWRKSHDGTERFFPLKEYLFG